jgi:hypothetical protein
MFEDAFPDATVDELLHMMEPDAILTFQVHLKNFKLQNFNNVRLSLILYVCEL